MRRIVIFGLLTALVLSGCSSAEVQNEATAAEEFQKEMQNEVVSNHEPYSVPEVVAEIAEDTGAIEHTEANQEGGKKEPGIDFYLESGMENGEFFELPGLTGEEADMYRADNYLLLLRMRLESNGIYLNPDRYEQIFPDIYYGYLPMTIGHYEDFDLLYLQYPGYRGTYTGNLYVFEHSMFVGELIEAGDIDFSNCFRKLEDNLWLVATRHSGGSGLSVEYQEWTSLTDDRLPVALQYTNYYLTGNYRYEPGIAFSLELSYEAREEALYINDENIPVVKVSWQKEVYDTDRIIELTADGYGELAVSEFQDEVAFSPFVLMSGELMDGLEEQLKTLIKSGSEEQRQMANQIVTAFAIP